MQQALKQERDKGEGLARDLLRHAARSRRRRRRWKAADKTAETQQLAEVQQALKQEHDKGEGLARDLAAARREIETQAAALKKATDKTAETQQLAEVQQALKQEHDKGEGLARDPCWGTPASIEAQAAALKKATDKTAETQTARRGAAGAKAANATRARASHGTWSLRHAARSRRRRRR